MFVCSLVCFGCLVATFFERMASKAAYVRPIQDLSVVAGRVSEQVCGRVVHHFTETFKKGSSKTVAVIVDGQSLRSVLVLPNFLPAPGLSKK